MRMKPEEWEKVSSILDQVLDLGTEERLHFLANLRRDDPQLCSEVESLLNHELTPGVFEAPPPDQLAAIEPTATSAKMPGQLGPYRLVRILGAGGMGVVYEAEDPTLQRKVALKVMKAGHDLIPQAHARFLREARAAAALHHDHVMPVYHVGEENGVVFLVMPLLQGETLEARLRRMPLFPIDQVLRIGREVAAGLSEAHGRGLIHRDIKPANIWLEGGTSRVKIMDFGLARPSETPDGGLTQSGVILGTPGYMPPEQGRGEEVDGRGDLFSLGCILYRMTTGNAPFQRDQAIASILAAATETPTSPREINSSIPTALSDFILKLLAKKPADRPRSAAEVVDCLATLERNFERAHADTSTMHKDSAIRSRMHWAILAAALLLVGLAIGVYLVVTNTAPDNLNRDPPPIAHTHPAAHASDFPAIQEWLATKSAQQILTVARDGSGMYRTLGDAVDALKPGQVVKLLDKGPYREDLRKTLPEDTCIVSEVGTRVELPRWHKHFPGPTGYFYHGASLTAAGGAYLAGLEIVGPELESDSFYTALLMLQVRGKVIVEGCRFLHRPAYPMRPPPADFFPTSYFTALHIDGTPQKDSACTVRTTFMHGSLVLSHFATAPQTTLIEKNQIIGWRRVGIGLDSRTPGSVTIRHNVVLGDTLGVGVGLQWQNCGFPISITNNYFEQSGPSLSFDQFNADAIKLQGGLALPAQLRFENNIIHSAQARSISLLLEGQEVARQKWKIGHNCYRINPAAGADLPRHESDLVRQEPFLSDDRNERSRFLRIAADSPLATGGAGGDLPNYLGPFPPGPAPNDGDWFTRFLDQSDPK